MAARLVGLSLSVEPLRACYIPLAHRYAGVPEQLPFDATLAALRPWLESPHHRKVGQHLKYDTHVFANHGVRLAGIAHDTLLESYVLEAHRSHDMDSLAERHLGRKTITFDDVCGKGASQLRFDEVALDRATEYAAEDAEVTLALHHALWPHIEPNEKLRSIYQDIELPVAQVLFEMERTGVLIDRAKLQAQSGELARRIAELETAGSRTRRAAVQPRQPEADRRDPVRATEAAGRQEDGERRTVDRRGGAGEARRGLPAAEGAARAPRSGEAEVDLLRQAAGECRCATGRVHTTYGQAIAVTGRLSSSRSEPAEHPDPHRRRPPHPRGLHRAAGPAGSCRRTTRRSSCASWRTSRRTPGCSTRSSKGEDIHRATASEVFGVPVGEVTSEQRRYAKVINFGLIYGMSAFGLAGNLGIEREAAKSYIDRYFTRYPGVAKYMERTRGTREAAGLCRDRVRSPAVAAGDQLAERPAAQARGTGGDQCADAGHRGRPDQARDDRGIALDRRREPGARGSSCRCTTNSCSKCRRPKSSWCANACRR